MREIIFLDEDFGENVLKSLQKTGQDHVDSEYHKLARSRAIREGLLTKGLPLGILSFLLTPVFGAIWCVYKGHGIGRTIGKHEQHIKELIEADPELKKKARELAKAIEDGAPYSTIRAMKNDFRIAMHAKQKNENDD